MTPRYVYMVLSPHALPYGELALRTLLNNSDESLALTLITDSAADAATLRETLDRLGLPPKHTTRVVAEQDLREAEADRFGRYPNLRRFRHGHPCWRKITDPVLLGTPGDELVLLDPDLYFPNRFRFEPTPATGLLLMWQRPNCLLPPATVRTALQAGIRLARHVDIGVAHWRLSPDFRELDWLDWLLGKLGGPESVAALPRVMHIEAIVWSAIAMHGGGGYLDPAVWRCWHRTQGKRIRRKLGTQGQKILRAEPWHTLKCFHAGGEAKWWLPDAEAAGELAGREPQLVPGRILPYVPLTPTRYKTEQRVKGVLGRLGYHRLFNATGP